MLKTKQDDEKPVVPVSFNDPCLIQNIVWLLLSTTFGSILPSDTPVSSQTDCCEPHLYDRFWPEADSVLFWITGPSVAFDHMISVTCIAWWVGQAVWTQLPAATSSFQKHAFSFSPLQMCVCVCVSHARLQAVSHLLHFGWRRVQRQELTEGLVQHALQLQTNKQTHTPFCLNFLQSHPCLADRSSKSADD